MQGANINRKCNISRHQEDCNRLALQPHGATGIDYENLFQLSLIIDRGHGVCTCVAVCARAPCFSVHP